MANTVSQQAFSRFLKFWRSVHKLSQEEFAFRLGSSPRHISRLENGSSRPSEEIIKQISVVLNLGERDSNHLLMSAGFAPTINKVDVNDPKLKWLRKAMLLNLKALDPHPTALLDGSTNIVMVNKAWVGFHAQQISSQNIASEMLNNITNIYDFFFTCDGAGSSITVWEDTLSVILMSLQQRALFSDDKHDYALVDKLASHSSVPNDWRQRGAKIEPMASFQTKVNIDGTLKRFFNVSSTVGALGPNAYASEPQLTINTLFAEDESLDLSRFVEHNIKHDLLFYS